MTTVIGLVLGSGTRLDQDENVPRQDEIVIATRETEIVEVNVIVMSIVEEIGTETTTDETGTTICAATGILTRRWIRMIQDDGEMMGKGMKEWQLGVIGSTVNVSEIDQHGKRAGSHPVTAREVDGLW